MKMPNLMFINDANKEAMRKNPMLKDYWEQHDKITQEQQLNQMPKPATMTREMIHQALNSRKNDEDIVL